MIPKIIHQIWYQGEKNIPKKYKKYQKTLKNHNPEFTFLVHDDQSMQNYCDEVGLLLGTPEIRKTYNNLNLMHQKIDFGRIVLAYLFGGITLDMDVISNNPIKNFINLDKAEGDLYLCPVEAGLFGKILFATSSKINITSFLKTKMVNNATMICTKLSPTVKSILLDYVAYLKNNENNSVWGTTGPGVFGFISNKYRNKIIFINNFEKQNYNFKKTATQHLTRKTWIKNKNIQKLTNLLEIIYSFNPYCIDILSIYTVICFISKFSKETVSV